VPDPFLEDSDLANSESRTLLKEWLGDKYDSKLLYKATRDGFK
jgi:hypothetical protein